MKALLMAATHLTVHIHIRRVAAIELARLKIANGGLAAQRDLWQDQFIQDRFHSYCMHTRDT